jgi:hypothetical protein
MVSVVECSRFLRGFLEAGWIRLAESIASCRLLTLVLSTVTKI